jgi:multidrug efflux pump
MARPGPASCLPLARSIFWGPMAITIMGGLFVATVLTLLVVPALYAMWFRVRTDESLDTSVGRPPRMEQFGWGPMPIPIAAE